jgi:hypothetical protein
MTYEDALYRNSFTVCAFNAMIYKFSFAIGHNSWSNESLLNSRPWLMMKVLLVLQVYSCQNQEKQQRKF